MVRGDDERHFFGDESGISLLEGLLVFPLILLTFSAFVEFTYAMHQWNQTVKAAQLGARFASVSDPITKDPISHTTGSFALDYAVNKPGEATPEVITSATCDGANPVDCNDAELARLVDRMKAFNNRIKLANVQVTYQRSGLGYVGRPNGPVVTITVELRNVSLLMPIMNGLLGADFDVPPSKAAITSEDLSSSN